MFDQEIKKWINTAKEYVQLNALSSLDAQQENRLGEILERAMHEPWLNFWIQEVDFLMAQDLDLLSDEKLESYIDQQSRLSENHIFGLSDQMDELVRPYYNN